MFAGIILMSVSFVVGFLIRGDCQVEPSKYDDANLPEDILTWFEQNYHCVHGYPSCTPDTPCKIHYQETLDEYSKRDHP